MNAKKSSHAHKRPPQDAARKNDRSGVRKRLSLFKFWIPVGLVLTALASVPGIYSSIPGISLQQGVLTVTTIRACLSWLIAAGALAGAIFVLVRQNRTLLRQYPLFLYLVCWFGALALPVVLLAWFQTPQVSYDLARYYVHGTIDERETRISSVEEICSGGRTDVCTLWVNLEDGSRYGTKGTLAQAIKKHGEIDAIRVLPRSGRLIGVRTRDGWL